MPLPNAVSARGMDPPKVRPDPASWIRGGAWERADFHIGLLAFALSLALHAAIWWLAPAELPRKPPGERPPGVARELAIVLPETPPSPEPERFVVTNPEAPSNPPDEASHFAARDQQPAQPEPSPRDAGTPEVTGELEEPTQAILAGEQPSPAEMAALAEETALIALPSVPPRPRPVPGFAENPESAGLEIPVAAEPDPDPLTEERVIEVPVKTDPRDLPFELAELLPGATEETVAPRPRPRVSRLANAPVGTRPGGVNRIGALSVDAKFSEFGDYLDRMLEAISRQWHILAWNSLPQAEVGTLVVVRFVMDAEGGIRHIEVAHSTAGLTATLICQDAITSRQPYGAWTPDMRAVLGERQTVTIRFFYR